MSIVRNRQKLSKISVNVGKCQNAFVGNSRKLLEILGNCQKLLENVRNRGKMHEVSEISESTNFEQNCHTRIKQLSKATQD